MRPLDEKETTLVFEKLFKFVGPNLKHIIDRPAVEGPDPSGYCFRLHKNRVYYASESLVRRATSISRPKLVSLGLPIGKITKSGQFRLTIHSLDLLTAHARNKIWLKPAAEMTFLYGNSVTKSMLARITENTKAGDGVVVLSMSDLPLGFGVAARSTQDCRKADTNAVVVHHQADNGEYLRNEEEL
ncbi:60S ribosome subunit biogenesis protein NIP7 [Carex littledalei]|uniref:60S ribosome subunit biogenesis protein NIP7 homolog n=1 Tax=Carex littledalei TaxID=544730 RepID=A0A833QIA2_9POAL|nr:60S ribosome subunit biogenesis protein NIP7 [Carex littledalei]